MMNSMENACDRIIDISRSLRAFARRDLDTRVAVDLHAELESTLLILKHRFKANDDRPEIELIKHYGELPDVDCFPSKLNQVFMNLLANAIDALEDSNQNKTYQEIQQNPNRITLETAWVEDQVMIRIEDNGTGISDTVQQRMFDHLYTTKEAGKGTGLGLTIVKQIIVDAHGGEIQVKSESGVGTAFILTLPVGESHP